MALQLDADVHVDRDDNGRIIAIHHTGRAYRSAEAGLPSAITEEIVARYLDDVAPLYELAPDVTSTAREAVTGAPTDEGLKLRKRQEKQIGRTRVIEFQYTYAGLPVFNSSLRVVVAEDPSRVINSSSNLQPVVPPAQVDVPALSAALSEEPSTLQAALGIDAPSLTEFKLNHPPRLVVYRYEPDERYDKLAVPVGTTPGGISGPDVSRFGSVPTLALPEVPPSIVPGAYYVTRELLFSLKVPLWGTLNWRALVELVTAAVLYVRAFTAGQTCCVFITDPVSATGRTLNGGSPAADLDAVRTLNQPLSGLVAPVGGLQALGGNFVAARDTDPPTVAPPQERQPFDFCYSAVTDGFAFTCGYFNHDLMFRMVEDFGFPAATYFDGATFPVPVDARGWGIVNAQAPGNTAGNGIGHFRYGLAAAGQPVSIACDPRICWHEFGHALLWDHVNSPNFGWCHSAGDTLAVILHDPDTQASDRFVTFPFIPAIVRRHDRDVTAGWAWGGSQDDTQYGSEQILSTTMFRIYRMSGGDSPAADERRRAARYLAYLIFHATGQLTATTTDPRVFVNALMTADTTMAVIDGRAGGVLHKVIRWSFERQGLYQPVGAPRPVTRPGAPPDVDVFIDDGRAGGYEPYQVDTQTTPGIWNRQTADGGLVHQQPIFGSPNAIYVRVGNRGTQAAANVRVRVYSATPAGAPPTWPADFLALAPAEIAAGAIASGATAIVGPFMWNPARDTRYMILASVSATGDVSNAETVTIALPSFRLALLDNNIASREIGGAQPLPWLSLLLRDEPAGTGPAIDILLS